MKTKRFLLLALPAFAFVLELLPYGAVLNFANPEGEPFRRTFSYFDLTPFGYANFGPFITAVLTVALMALATVYAINGGKTVYIAMTAVSGIATLSSLSPLLYGASFFSAVGAAISGALCAQLVLLLLSYKKLQDRDVKEDEQ